MLKKIFLSLGFIFASVLLAFAKPSTTYWTTCTEDIQAFGVWYITYDNYVSNDSSFPSDYGLTVGVLPFEKFQIQ